MTALKTEHPHPSGRPLDHRNHDADEGCRMCTRCFGNRYLRIPIGEVNVRQSCPDCFGTGCSRTREIEEGDGNG